VKLEHAGGVMRPALDIPVRVGRDVAVDLRFPDAGDLQWGSTAPLTLTAV
jgi:hypothetical protein